MHNVTPKVTAGTPAADPTLSWLPHAVSVGVGLFAGWLAHRTGLVVDPANQLILVGLVVAGVTSAMHWVQAKYSSVKVTKSVAPALFLLMLLPLAMMLSGCASVEAFITKNPLAAQLAVEAGTDGLLQIPIGSTTVQQRAARLAVIMGQIEKTADLTSGPLPTRIATINARIAALKLTDPIDTQLAQLAAQVLTQFVAEGLSRAKHCIRAGDLYDLGH